MALILVVQFELFYKIVANWGRQTLWLVWIISSSTNEKQELEITKLIDEYVRIKKEKRPRK